MNTPTIILTALFCLFSLAIYAQKKSNEKGKITDSTDELEGKSHYANPIDQKVYSTEGEFKTYQPEKVIEKTMTELDHVVLLNGDEELTESISIEDLGSLIEEIKALFQKHFSTSKGSGRIMIQVAIHKEKEPELQYATQDDIDLEIMTAFEKEMRELKTPYSKAHTITFQLIFRVNLLAEE